MADNAVIALYSKLCRLGFPYWSAVSEKDLYSGAPYLFTDFIRFILNSYQGALLVLTQKYSWFLLELSDVRLISMIFRLLHEEGQYKVPITLSQFEQQRFANIKAKICIQLISILKQNEPLTRSTRTKIHRSLQISPHLYKNDKQDLIDLKQLVHIRSMELNKYHTVS